MADAALVGMGMGVHQTGQNRPSLQIDDFCLRTGMAQGFLVASHLNQFTLPNCQSLDNRELPVNGDNLSIVKDIIGVIDHSSRLPMKWAQKWPGQNR